MARSRSRSALPAQAALVTGSVGENASANPAVPNPSQRRVTRSRSREIVSTGRSDDVGPAGAPADGARRRWGQNKGRMSKLSGYLALKQGFSCSCISYGIPPLYPVY
jgi:hypothetical protein